MAEMNPLRRRMIEDMKVRNLSGLPRDWGCGSKRVLSGSLIGERRQRGLDPEAGKHRGRGRRTQHGGHADPRLVAWVGGVGALSPPRVPGYVMRTYSGGPSSSIRF